MPIETRVKDQQSIYQLKHKRRPTYRYIAAQTGLGVATVSNLANNQSQGVSWGTLEALCRFFECEPGDLIVLVDDRGQADE